MKSAVVRAVIGLAMALPFAAFAASITHQPIAYFVPEKRIRVDAGISDPKGVQVARVYFKAGAQADYIFVPMQPAGGRYVATLPAPSASANALEYLVLASNNDGQVSRTEAYKVAARRTSETPSWQSAGGQGDVKVFTEIPDMPKPIAAYSDSIAMDVVESGARLGAAAGLYAGTGGAGGAAGAATAKSAAGASTTTSTTAASASAVGGLSTAAIVGGVVVAGAAVAAASGGGGGGGSGGSSTPSAPSGPAAFAGAWSGTFSVNATVTCTNSAGNATCSASAPFSGNADAAGNFVGSSQPGTWSCSGSSVATSITGATLTPQTFNSTISANGTATFLAATNPSAPGVSAGCPALVVTFTSSPHHVGGTMTCSGTVTSTSFGSCSFTEPVTISGS